MTVKELLEKEKGKYVNYEAWQYTDARKLIHTDYVKDIEMDYSYEELLKLEVEDYEIMGEEEYDTTLLANSVERADFEIWYDDKDAKVLVIIAKVGD